MIVLSVVISLENLISGFYVKIPILYFLGKGVDAAMKAEKELAQLASLGIPKSEIETAKKLEQVPRTVLVKN